MTGKNGIAQHDVVLCKHMVMLL